VEAPYTRLKGWLHAFEQQGAQPAEYRTVGADVAAFEPTAKFDPDDLAPAELDAMEKAVLLLRPMPMMRFMARIFSTSKNV
jgi:hypothetical protein